MNKRTCSSCGRKRHKIKDSESQLNILITYKENLKIQELQSIIVEI